MLQSQHSPFTKFTDRISKDLLAWTLRKQQYQGLLKDYQSTLKYVQTQKNAGPTNILVDLGTDEGVYAQARRVDANFIIRVKDDLYVEFSSTQADKVLKQLSELYKQKIAAAETEIRKITASMKQVEQLMQQYSMLV